MVISTREAHGAINFLRVAPRYPRIASSSRTNSACRYVGLVEYVVEMSLDGGYR